VRREMVARVDPGSGMTEPELHIDGVTKRFAADGGKGPSSQPDRRMPALQDLTLSAARGEILVVVGPSGCGKSTALRIVAGLEKPDAGSVTIAGRLMNGVPPQERDVAMVFQGYALYPQMTAREILEFPLKMRRVAAVDRARVVRETAALLRIDALLDRRPSEMSGGERQRVAMGRAIVRKPRLFLFDEPLSNLDASLRSDIRLEIGQLVRRLGVTALYVTHDHVEAMTLADRIAVLRAGRLLQVGTPRDLYERPACSFVATFLGAPRMNILPAELVNDGPFVQAGPFRVPRPSDALPARFEVGIRPEDVHLGDAGVPGEIVALEPLGAETHMLVRVGDLMLRAVARGFDTRGRGEAVRVSLDVDRAQLFDAEGEGARVG
jgi:multiple sugar transport system ATP-binding protein